MKIVVEATHEELRQFYYLQSVTNKVAHEYFSYD